MLSQYRPKLFTAFIKPRCFTQATAVLRHPQNKSEQVQCRVIGAPYHSVMISKAVGCSLAGRDLGSQVAKVDLTFYDGCHFALDKLRISSRLTLTREAALLLDCNGRAEISAVLFHGGPNNGSAVTFKGTDGEEMWNATAHGTEAFQKALLDMK